MRARLREEVGQAAMEYVAVLLVIALALAGVASAVAGPTAIGHGVTRGLARALCIVDGGLCDADIKPCVVAGDERTSSWHVSAVIFRYGKDDLLLREQRSDGSVAITHVHGTSLGVDVAIGARIEASGLGINLAGQASMLGRDGSGTTWIASDAEEADRIEAAIRSGEKPPGAAATSEAWGTRGALSLSAAAGPIASAGASLTPSADDVVGVDAATGRRTLAIEAASEDGASLLGGTKISASAGGRSTERYAVVLDADGRARELVVTESGSATATASLPGVLDEAGPSWRRGKRWTAEAHLDLSDPEAARATAAYFDQLRRPIPHVGIPRAPATLRRLIAERADIELRSYDLDASSSSTGGEVGEGMQAGLGKQSGEVETHLVSAMSRGPDGAWRVRDDCLDAA